MLKKSDVLIFLCAFRSSSRLCAKNCSQLNPWLTQSIAARLRRADTAMKLFSPLVLCALCEILSVGDLKFNCWGRRGSAE